MARQITILVALMIGMVFFCSPVGASDLCGESINAVCVGCHNVDRVCEKLGESAEAWQGLLEWMVANGAELEKDEIAALAQCFSEPSADAKAACGK